MKMCMITSFFFTLSLKILTRYESRKILNRFEEIWNPSYQMGYNYNYFNQNFLAEEKTYSIIEIIMNFKNMTMNHKHATTSDPSLLMHQKWYVILLEIFSLMKMETKLLRFESISNLRLSSYMIIKFLVCYNFAYM